MHIPTSKSWCIATLIIYSDISPKKKTTIARLNTKGASAITEIGSKIEENTVCDSKVLKANYPSSKARTILQGVIRSKRDQWV